MKFFLPVLALTLTTVLAAPSGDDFRNGPYPHIEFRCHCSHGQGDIVTMLACQKVHSNVRDAQAAMASQHYCKAWKHEDGDEWEPFSGLERNWCNLVRAGCKQEMYRLYSAHETKQVHVESDSESE